ncbi:MAG: ATP-dependent DNA helicase RecQ [Flavobacteriaceae bacterium]|nr:ATP-dependent DNA helicase RecQ [Flavobacteriaceae bacterium]|tara:strand:- start:7637 stop:9826 length:2190 start_codon:yes stop_codon:yes gene_type:complete
MIDEELHDVLRKNFGFSSFKGLQKDIIKNILNLKDSFVIMPTGGGKSLCYQLPALIKDGTSIIVSPLIALMKNQVDSIRGFSSSNGIAHVLNSTLNKTEIKEVKNDVKNGVTKLLYVAPESLAKSDNINFFKSIKVSFLAVDEAHCISEWGHDFRPDYRNIRKILDQFSQQIPIIALTATATLKVQDDIMKNLEIQNANIFRASFNRPNLYYEVRHKNSNIDSEIIKFINKNKNKSGIIYCLSRKKVEELSETLIVNNINALPYHAGLDSKTRVSNQDSFLQDDCDVIVATIAFGMGIDKPDVRFVIHYDIPKSIESYYQETGRAGRDGGEGHCLAFYSYKDIEKLEKFLSGKPIAEKEIGLSLLDDMLTYCETSISRRKFILHYFGEEFDNDSGDGGDMDDNVRFPKEKIEAKDELLILLDTISETNQKYKLKEIIKILIGETNALIISHKTHEKDIFGRGRVGDKKQNFWKSLLRQSIVAGYLKKDIEDYGIIRITNKGKDFIKNPHRFIITKDQNFDEIKDIPNNIQKINIDSNLMKMLLKLRKEVASDNNIPPYAVFQQFSLDDMCLKYPVTEDEMVNIVGVGEGKAKRYSEKFTDLIKKYVDENDIIRADDLIVKSTGQNSSMKLYLIQNIDRKLPLDDIASSKGVTMDKLISEMETIVLSGTKLNIDYWIDDIFDDDQLEELNNYFLDSESGSIKNALEDFEGDYEEEEIRLFKIKFLTDIAN